MKGMSFRWRHTRKILRHDFWNYVCTVCGEYGMWSCDIAKFAQLINMGTGDLSGNDDSQGMDYKYFNKGGI